MFISESNTTTFFSSSGKETDSSTTDRITCAHNLVGTQWFSDVYMANLINSKNQQCSLLVAQHPTVMFTQDLLVKLERGQDIYSAGHFCHSQCWKGKNGDTRIAFESGNGRCR